MNPYSEKTPNILVVGDVILDVGIHGTVAKMAAEAPVPVHRAEEKTYSLGGAGNVVANLCALGARVWVCTPVGADGAAETIHSLYQAAGVAEILNPWVVVGNSTSVNTRGFMDGKLLYRYDAYAEGNAHGISAMEDLSLRTIEDLFDCGEQNIHCVVLSDYNKGFMTERFCQMLIELCNGRGIPTVVDPRGDFGKYAGCTVLKPNHKEARAAADGSPYFETVVEHLVKVVKPQYICITAAEEGLHIVDVAADCAVIHVPVEEVHDVIDVTGAGDIVATVIGFGMAVGSTIENACRSAVFLASRSVHHSGTYVLQPEDLWALVRHLSPGKMVRSVRYLQALPRAGRTVVFTNGCFDLLHRGHLESLRWAKAQGDILIVGVNSDESVRKLKGMTRPIISLEDRMEMLAALECVDYVIPFGEDRPRDLIAALRPDVYVKGAEYEGHTFSGQDYVGEVRLAPMFDGMSTTALIRRIIQPVHIHLGSGPAGR